MNLASQISADVLKAIAPSGLVPRSKQRRQAAIIAAFGSLLPELLAFAEINTPLRVCNFLAQVAHESDMFCTTEEYASGSAYEGRKDLGNTVRGDGVRFKGRGPIQLTGRTNYRNFSLWMRATVANAPDFIDHPGLVAEFPWAAHAAIWFWTVKRLNVVADRDDLVAVTRIINGGRNGLAHRAELLARAKAVIMRLAAGRIASSQDGGLVLRRGSEGEEVEALQAALSRTGTPLAIDGQFGPATELAVRIFQKAHGLVVDGIVGQNTQFLLNPFRQKEHDNA